MTYVSPWLQVLRVNGVLVEAWPFFERFFGPCLIFVIVPVQHLGLEFEVYTFAKLFQDAFRVIEEIVSIDHTDLHSFSLGLARVLSIGNAVRLLRVGIAVCVICVTWSDLAYLSQIVKDAMNLVVPSFDWIEIVETSKRVERRNGAAIVGWDARVRVADQESEVKFGQHFGRDDCWVAGFWFGVVWGVCGLVARACPIDAVDTIGAGAVRSDSALDTLQRWGDACWLATGRHKIVDNVLDEDTLTLVVGK
jgi:hypothetical protein